MRRRFPLVSVALALALTGVSACESDSLKPLPDRDDERLYWALELNHRAIWMSTAPGYDTLTLVTTPRNPRGDALGDAPAPRYLSRSPDRLSVDTDGVLRARGAGPEPVWVVATLTIGNVRRVDSALVYISDADEPPRLATFSARPLPPDSAKRGVGGLVRPTTLPVRATDSAGMPVDGLPVAFRSSDSTVAGIDPLTGEIYPFLSGAVTFYASTTAFGVHKADTVPYRIGIPLSARVNVAPAYPANRALGNTFLPEEVTIAAGGIVIWSANDGLGDTVATDIVFAEADVPNVLPAITAASFMELGVLGFCPLLGCDLAGNVSIPIGFPSALRVLAEPGVYQYRSLRTGATGRVVVVADP